MEDYSFTAELAPLSSEQMEQLRALCRCEEYTIGIEVDGKFISIATIRRHEDCPEELFQKARDAFTAADIKI